MTLSPAVKTSITGEGSVVVHDVTQHGLCRMCVASREKYPDLELWSSMLPASAKQIGHRYLENFAKTTGVLWMYLWIYYKGE